VGWPLERFVIDDVLPWTDAHLPTIRSPAGRAIGGLSSGGFGAINMALRHPTLLATIEAWSGYFHPLRDGPFAHATRAQLRANDPTLLLRRHAQLLRNCTCACSSPPADKTRSTSTSPDTSQPCSADLGSLTS
jgi:S-formylglutathione hydrolase FrmB